MRGMVGIAVAAILLAAGPAGAVPFTLMFERDDDVVDDAELIFRSHTSFDDLVGNADPSDAISPIDIASNFSTTGLTFDGLRHIVMFERDDDVVDDAELIFRVYDSFDDMLGNVDPTDFISPIDIASNFSTTGLTFDGLRYILMFERDDDVVDDAELIFRVYDSFDDMLGNVVLSDFISPIDIASNFSTTGLTWDGSRYVLSFERDDDVVDDAELIFRSHTSFENLVGNADFSDAISAIDIASNFSTTGLMAHVDFNAGPPPPAPVPLPPALALMAAALAGLAGFGGGVRRRRAA
jgi:hypothetical protein